MIVLLCYCDSKAGPIEFKWAWHTIVDPTVDCIIDPRMVKDL